MIALCVPVCRYNFGLLADITEIVISGSMNLIIAILIFLHLS